MRDRPTIEVPQPVGGWVHPWPSVAEIALALPHRKWTLVGGLMAQLHASYRGIDAVRPTSDVDVLLHIETTRGVVTEAARCLESLGYRFTPSIDDRNTTAHRFKRSQSGSTRASSRDDVVDVMVADHAAPAVAEKFLGRTVVAIPGGTQALRRTVNARLEITPGLSVTVSVPKPFGAALLKAAAYQADSRDKERHLQDAALLLAAIEDPFEERAGFTGSDRRRLRILERALPETAREWRALPEPWLTNAQTALRILLADPD